MQLVQIISALLIFCFGAYLNPSPAYLLEDYKNPSSTCSILLATKLRDSCITWHDSTSLNKDIKKQHIAEIVRPPHSPSIHLHLTEDSFWSKNSISIAALIVSLLSAILSVTQFAKNRNRSIQDDFWIRQIINPHFIQPYLHFTQWCHENAPPPHAQNQNIEHFRSEFRKQWNDISNRSSIFEVLKNAKINQSNKNPLQKIIIELENIEDETMEYLALCIENESDFKNHNQYLDSLQRYSHLVLKKIYDWQHSI